MLSFFCILLCVSYVANQNVMRPKVLSPVMSEVTLNGSTTGRSKRATTCVLPAYPDHGTYDVLTANKAPSGQSYVTLLLSVRCQQGYGMENSDTPYGNRTLVLCNKGVWYQSIPKCVRFCKLDPEPSVVYHCHIPDVGFKTCEGYLAPGTLVSPVCRSPEYSSTDIVLDMECIGGRWNYVAKCKADCGQVVPDGGIGLIAGGTYSAHGQVPWHVGIYQKTSTPYQQICGGTIVTTKVVISAAHCFPSGNPSEYAVAAGKIYRPWEDAVDTKAQKSDVIEIKIPQLYQGATGHFGVDISVVVLATPLVLNSFVRPVCLSFDANFDRLQLQPGLLGKVAGWGLTSANGAASPILQVADLPFISVDSCLKSVPPHFKPYITGDKFCAGYNNGTASCKGDSGGGLAFPDKERGVDRYYLRGIVSTAPKNNDAMCNDRSYTAFTRVAVHQDFIKNVIAVSERNSCQGADCDEVLQLADSKYVYYPKSHRKIAEYNETVTWEEAKQRCESEGATLASPLSEELLQDMRTIITANSQTTPYFIGFKARDNTEFSSEEGVLLEDVPEAFDMVEQMDPVVGDCLCMDGHSIRIESCWSRLPFICYTDEMTVDALSEIPTITHKRKRRQCGPDYKLYPTGCYKLHKRKMSWTDAYWKCAAEVAYLVVINDSNEARAVADIIKGSGSREGWVGLRDVKGNQDWTAITGERIDEVFHNWATTHKNDDPCGLLSNYGKLDDHPCHHMYYFVCEK